MKELEIKIEVLSELIKEQNKSLNLVHIKLFNQEKRLEQLLEKINLKEKKVKGCDNCEHESLSVHELPCYECRIDEGYSNWEEKK